MKTRPGLTQSSFAALLVSCAVLFAGCASLGNEMANGSDYDEAKVLKMIDDGANPNAWTNNGMNERVLNTAIRDGKNSVALALIAHGANVNIVDKNELNETPLHHAAVYCNAEVAAALIAKGADINARNKGQMTPLLLASGDDLAIYHMPQCLAVVKLLVDKGADIHAVDGAHCTALHAAASVDDGALIAYYIGKGLDVNARCDGGDPKQKTPLLLVAYSGGIRSTDKEPDTFKTSPDTAALLLKAGGDINAEDQEGYTPLTRALWAHNTPLALYLKAQGGKAGPKVSENQAVQAGFDYRDQLAAIGAAAKAQYQEEIRAYEESIQRARAPVNVAGRCGTCAPGLICCHYTQGGGIEGSYQCVAPSQCYQ